MLKLMNPNDPDQIQFDRSAIGSLPPPPPRVFHPTRLENFDRSIAAHAPRIVRLGLLIKTPQRSTLLSAGGVSFSGGKFRQPRWSPTTISATSNLDLGLIFILSSCSVCWYKLFVDVWTFWYRSESLGFRRVLLDFGGLPAVFRLRLELKCCSGRCDEADGKV